MSLSSIRSLIATVGEYYKDDDTKPKAQEFVHSLTSEEREEIYRIIKESNPPPTNRDQLSGKLQEIHNVISVKDGHLTRFELILINIWRAIKDIIGLRISDQKLLQKIDSYSKRYAEMSDARADIPGLFFTTCDGLEVLLAVAKKTPNFDSEIIPLSDYQTLGLVGTSFSLDELEIAYMTILKNHAKDPIRLAAAKKAFQTTHALNQVKLALLPDKNQPLTLKAASQNSRTLPPDQRNKLTFLIKIFTNLELYK